MFETDPSYPRILVLRSGALGDCLLSTPAIAALRRQYPEARITVIGDPFSSEIFTHSPDVDEVIAVEPRQMSRSRYLAMLLKLRRRRFSLLLDMHGNGRTFMQTLLIGGKRRIGFDVRRSRSFVYTDRVPYRMEVHTVLRQAEVLKPLGVELDPAAAPLRLTVPDADRKDARRLLQDAGLAGGRYVVLHATAGSGRNLKQWLPDRYAALSDRIQQEIGVPVVLTGHSTDDTPAVHRMIASMQAPVVDLYGKTDLRVLNAVLEGAELYVGCDTGPMHVAAALGTPVVALFGPSDPVRWHPWSTAPYRLIRAGLDCSPCPGKECPYNVECMSAIEVEPVLAAVQEMVALHLR